MTKDFCIELSSEKYYINDGWYCSALTLPGSEVTKIIMDGNNIPLEKFNISASHIIFVNRPEKVLDVSVYVRLNKSLISTEKAIIASIITALTTLLSTLTLVSLKSTENDINPNDSSVFDNKINTIISETFDSATDATDKVDEKKNSFTKKRSNKIKTKTTSLSDNEPEKTKTTSLSDNEPEKTKTTSLSDNEPEAASDFTDEIQYLMMLDISTGNSCNEYIYGNHSSGTDLFYIEILDKEKKVIGFAQSVHYMQGSGQVDDTDYSILNGSKIARENDDCPLPKDGKVFNTQSVFSLGCGGTLLFNFIDNSGKIIDLKDGMFISIGEYKIFCDNLDKVDDYDNFKILICVDTESAANLSTISCTKESVQEIIKTKLFKINL